MKEKLLKFNQSKCSTYIFMLLIFIVNFVLCISFIHTHDDYTTFGMYSFKRAASESLYFGNGRFLGNFIVNYFLCRPIIDKLFRAVAISSVVFFLPLITDNLRKKTLMISSLLVMGVTKVCFAQVYTWGHGFYNYVPPVALLLVSVFIVKKYYDGGTDNKHTAIYVIALAAIGFSEQLFSENSTIINVLIAFSILAVVLFKKDKKLVAGAYALSTLCGAAVMMLLPKALGVSEKMDFYRKVSFTESFYGNLRNILNFLSVSYVIWVVISLVLISQIRHKAMKKGPAIVYLAVFPVISALTYFFDSLNGWSEFMEIFTLTLFPIYLIAVFWAVFKVFDIKTFARISAVGLFSAASLGELLFASVTGERCFYISYILIAVAAMIMIKNSAFLENKGGNIASLACMGIILLAVYITVYYINFTAMSVDKVRTQYVYEQLEENKNDIEIIIVPNEEWFQWPNASYAYSYRYNHGDPDAMTFTYITMDEYLAKKGLE